MEGSVYSEVPGGRSARAAGIPTQREREKEEYVSEVQPVGTPHLRAMLSVQGHFF